MTYTCLMLFSTFQCFKGNSKNSHQNLEIPVSLLPCFPLLLWACSSLTFPSLNTSMCLLHDLGTPVCFCSVFVLGPRMLFLSYSVH